MDKKNFYKKLEEEKEKRKLESKNPKQNEKDKEG